MPVKLSALEASAQDVKTHLRRADANRDGRVSARELSRWAQRTDDDPLEAAVKSVHAAARRGTRSTYVKLTRLRSEVDAQLRGIVRNDRDGDGTLEEGRELNGAKRMRGFRVLAGIASPALRPVEPSQPAPVRPAPVEPEPPVIFRPPAPHVRETLTLQPTAEQSRNDRYIASIFGGPGAIAAANGFEPPLNGLKYRYRGDSTMDNGKISPGHLSSYAMHLYGSEDGTKGTALYIPAGYSRATVANRQTPSPNDAVVTFFYPRLGNQRNVTLALMHVKNFKPVVEGNRVRIGEIGGKGGDSGGSYVHAHIEMYRGDVGLPPPRQRERLRIPHFPAVFTTPDGWQG